MSSWWERYRLWLEHPCFDEPTRAELAALQENPAEIEDRFYRDLDFGTGGLRGIIGAGTNRINRYVIRQAARGLAAYIASFGIEAKRKGVVIAHDSRRCSPEFAREAALVLAAAGVRAHLWESLRPTPMLSFAVRELGATAGIVVTASHNPPEYNGFKVYWSDGGQVPPERAAAIKEQMALAEITEIALVGEREARAAGLLFPVPSEVDRAYMDRVLQLVGGPDARRQGCRVLYTPLHGSGHIPVRQVLNEARFAVTMVREQMDPDPAFPTVTAPNPEDPAVFALALAQAEHLQPDVILATDPDADRLGVMAREATGAYRLLTGNQIGALLVDFILRRSQDQGTLPDNGAVLKSIATANMAAPICRQHGVTLIDTHTGFKFIGDKIREWEETGEHSFLFGYEESYGYLAGSFVRDKDAVMSTLLVAEAAAWHKRRGRTLCEALEELWFRHGYYRESLHSLTLPGKDGLEKMAALMRRLREHPPAAFGPAHVAFVDDYLTGLSRAVGTGAAQPLALGRADVLHYRFADGGFVMVRPSGTEPKLKAYVAVTGPSAAEADERLARVSVAARALLA
ncbi:MAG TPA: phospho-sugar mutase [Symbiobacteriaceae bacterium]|nr:phospho-sugar mutase [Symbiobacteriaceae bacterium]